MRIFVSIVLIISGLYANAQTAPALLAQQQLDAYNARDIEAFLAPYSEEVEIYNFPDELLYKGKATMRVNYATMFDNTPDLHCHLVNRIILGNTVIDQERVEGFSGGQIIEAIAIYKIKDDKIAQVYFIRK